MSRHCLCVLRFCMAQHAGAVVGAFGRGCNTVALVWWRPYLRKSDGNILIYLSSISTKQEIDA